MGTTSTGATSWTGGAPRLHLWAGIGLLSLLALYVALNRSGIEQSDQTILNIYAGIVVPLVGCHLCFAGAPIARKDVASKVPGLLGASSVVYAVATAIFLLESLAGPRNGIPKWSDFCYAAAYIFLIGALLFWPTRPVPKDSLPKIVSSAMMLFFGSAAFSWYFLLGPMLDSWRLDQAGMFATLVFPLGDLLLMVLFAIAIWRGVPPSLRPATILAAVGVLAITTADTHFFSREIHTRLGPGAHGMDIVWPMTCVLMNLSGGWIRFALGNSGAEPIAPESPWSRPGARRWLQAGPTLFIPLSAVLVWHAIQTGASSLVQGGLYWIVFMLMTAIIVDQLLGTWEKGKLYDDLSEAFVQLGKSRAQLAEQYSQLEEANIRLERLALVDGLTGLRNHRAFFEELRRATDERIPRAILLLDIDYFKQYNDEFGHPTGDQTLRTVAQAIRDTIPVDAMAARFGGDEFAVYLRGEKALEASAVADLIRATVAGAPARHRAVTVSVGWTFWNVGASLEDVMEAADRALFGAKSIGKNTVFGGALEMPGVALLDTHRKEADLSDEPMAVGRLVIDGLRCDPFAVIHEPSAPLVAGLLNTLELKDPDTRMHSERVMWFALYFAEIMMRDGLKLTRDNLRALAYGALLHDIGKINIPTGVLRSARRLTDEEFTLMRSHTRIGFDMLTRFPDLAVGGEVVLYHHEQWDGRGYPMGLAGADIPLIARIFGLIDAVDAMGSNRPYSPAMPWEAIVEELECQAGRHFDPVLVEKFLRVPKERWDLLRRTQYRIVAPTVGRV